MEWTLSSCSSSAALGRWYGLAMVITCCRWWLDFPPAHAPQPEPGSRREAPLDDARRLLRPPGRCPCGCPAGQANGRLRPWSRPAAGVGGAPVTRRLLVVAAVVAVLGLAATPALEETAVGGWFSVPWEGNRGLGQPGQPAEPTAPSTMDRQGESAGQRASHAKPRAHGHGPKVRPPKGKPDTPAATRRPARNPHASPRCGRR